MKIAGLTLGLLLPLSSIHADCRPVSLAEFREATVKGPDRIVFFASWCASCASHIRPDRLRDTIFVASADDRVKADRVMQVYLKDRAEAATCFFDKDEAIARAFGVRNLPAEKSLSELPKP